MTGNGTSRVIRWLSIVGAVVTLIGLIFTAGYNWRRIEELQAWQMQHATAATDLATAVAAVYVRRDVAEQQYRTLTLQIEQVQKDIADVKTLVRQR